MAQRDLDVVIGARTDAASFKRAEQKTAGFMKQIAGRGEGGVVAQAAALHHSLQRIGAAAEMAKTAMAGMDGILKGAAGDTEGMVESFKQLGFGIGEVVARLDTLADTISNRIYGVTQDMLDEEQRLNAEHARRVELQKRQAAEAEKARQGMADTIVGQSKALQLLEATTDAEKARIEANHRLGEVHKRVLAQLAKANKDISEEERKRAKAQAEQILMNAHAIEQKKQEKAISEKVAAELQTEAMAERLHGKEGKELEKEQIKIAYEKRLKELSELRAMLDKKTEVKQRVAIGEAIWDLSDRFKDQLAAVDARDAEKPTKQRPVPIELPSLTEGAQLGGFAQAAMAGGEFRIEERKIATATRDNTKDTVAILRELLSISRSTGYLPILN
ncbi:MAG: hypothetical protein JSU89_12555 [Myxococcales bacterium]|nr:MAG: hypothetical protein JSU89_12555 [Myxococcales bacterium]